MAIPAAVAAGAAIADAGANAYAAFSGKNRTTQKRAEKFAREQQTVAQQNAVANYKMQVEDNRENWRMANEYNDPKNQMARASAAGINPNLSASEGGITNTSTTLSAAAGASPASTSGSYSGNSNETPSLGFVQALSAQQNMALQSSQAELNRSNANYLNSLAGKTDLDAAMLRAALPLEAKRIDSEIRANLSRANLAEAETSAIPSLISLRLAQVGEIESRKILNNAEALHTLSALSYMAIKYRNETVTANALASNASTNAGHLRIAEEKLPLDLSLITAQRLNELYSAWQKGPDALAKELRRQSFKSSVDNGRNLSTVVESFDQAMKIVRGR